MPKAASRHSTKPSPAPHRGRPQATSTDPVVDIAHQIQRLWDAHRGSEVEEFEARKSGDVTHEEIQDERRSQIFEWLNALQLVGSFAVATSLPGAMIQLSWAMNDVDILTGNLETNEREGNSRFKVTEYAHRIERLLKSIADVLAPSLGPDYEPIRKIVETYIFVGDSKPNWLLNVDHWAELAELDRKQEKQIRLLTVPTNNQNLAARVADRPLAVAENGVTTW